MLRSGAAEKLLESWERRPSKAVASSLRTFYSKHALSLPLPVRAGLCVALGEAAEVEGRFEVARHLYASAVCAVDPQKNEVLYARAALRALLNASRLGDLAVLAGVAAMVEKLPEGETTPRLAGLGAAARGLERMLAGDWMAARKAFEAAMGASWESRDADAEALAHHLLAQAWGRIGRMARANEHVEAARKAAARAGSRLLERRFALEQLLSRLTSRLTPAGLAEARRFIEDARARGFPRLESMAWSKLTLRLLPGRAYAEAFLARSEALLPEGHADRTFVREVQEGLGRAPGGEKPPEKAILRELEALARLARA